QNRQPGPAEQQQRPPPIEQQRKVGPQPAVVIVVLSHPRSFVHAGHPRARGRVATGTATAGSNPAPEGRNPPSRRARARRLPWAYGPGRRGADPTMGLENWDDSSAVTYDGQTWAELCSPRFIDARPRPDRGVPSALAAVGGSVPAGVADGPGRAG